MQQQQRQQRTAPVTALMAAVAFAAPLAIMSRGAQGYSWPPTPPRWTRTDDDRRDSPLNSNLGQRQRHDDHDMPIIVSGSDSDSDDETAGGGGRQRVIDKQRSAGMETEEQNLVQSKQWQEAVDMEKGRHSSVSATPSMPNPLSASVARTSATSAASVAAVIEDDDSEAGDEEKAMMEDDEKEEETERKAHDGSETETEDENDVALQEAASHASVVQEVRDVQHEDFSASQRELQEEAAEAAAVTAPPQPSSTASLEASGSTSLPSGKRPHDAVSNISQPLVSKHHKPDALPTIVESKHDGDDEPMIDHVRTKVSNAASPPPPSASITAPTHNYFAVATSSSSPISSPVNAKPADTALNRPTTAAVATAGTKSPSPIAQPTSALKLIKTTTFQSTDPKKKPLTLNISPLAISFSYDPHTCPRLPADAPRFIGRQTKAKRSRLAAYQLLQRIDELEEELALADEAMLCDERAGKDVAAQWEEKIDALQEEMDETQEELETRQHDERERARKEYQAWYDYSRLGASEEEVKQMDEEDEQALADVDSDDSDTDEDSSDESAAEDNGTEEKENKESKEAPHPVSPTSNLLEQAEQPTAEHFKKALTEWQEAYLVNEEEFKRATESVRSHGGFTSGLFFEKGRKEESRGSKQPVHVQHELKQDETAPEVQGGVKDEQPPANGLGTVANKENVPIVTSSPKLTPQLVAAAPASALGSAASVSYPPVRSTKPNKHSKPAAPSLFFKPASPPLTTPATTAPRLTAAAAPTNSPMLPPQSAVVKQNTALSLPPSPLPPTLSSLSPTNSATSSASIAISATVSPSNAGFAKQKLAPALVPAAVISIPSSSSSPLASSPASSAPSLPSSAPLPFPTSSATATVGTSSRRVVRLNTAQSGIGRPANLVVNGTAPSAGTSARPLPRPAAPPDAGSDMIDLTDED